MHIIFDDLLCMLALGVACPLISYICRLHMPLTSDIDVIAGISDILSVWYRMVIFCHCQGSTFHKYIILYIFHFLWSLQRWRVQHSIMTLNLILSTLSFYLFEEKIVRPAVLSVILLVGLVLNLLVILYTICHPVIEAECYYIAIGIISGHIYCYHLF